MSKEQEPIVDWFRKKLDEEFPTVGNMLLETENIDHLSLEANLSRNQWRAVCVYKVNPDIKTVSTVLELKEDRVRQLIEQAYDKIDRLVNKEDTQVKQEYKDGLWDTVYKEVPEYCPWKVINMPPESHIKIDEITHSRQSVRDYEGYGYIWYEGAEGKPKCQSPQDGNKVCAECFLRKGGKTLDYQKLTGWGFEQYPWKRRRR